MFSISLFRIRFGQSVGGIKKDCLVRLRKAAKIIGLIYQYYCVKFNWENILNKNVSLRSAPLNKCAILVCSGALSVMSQLALAAAPVGTTITIQTLDPNGGFVWANASSGEVAANSSTPGTWGEYLVEAGHTPNTVAFKHLASGKYLRCYCGVRQSGEIKADARLKRGWESFTWHDHGNNTFSLTAFNQKVVWAAIDFAGDPLKAFSWSDDIQGYWAKLVYAPLGAPETSPPVPVSPVADQGDTGLDAPSDNIPNEAGDISNEAVDISNETIDDYDWGAETGNLPKPPKGYRWVLNSAFTDEFNTGWDNEKWTANMNWWDGQQGAGQAVLMPGEFGSDGGFVEGDSAQDTPNVDVADGTLKIYTLNNGSLSDALIYDAPNRAGRVVRGVNYGTGVVVSRTPAGQGYYEVRMKASEVASTSSFWLQNAPEDIRASGQTEIDVIESMGNPTTAIGQGLLRSLKTNSHYAPNGYGVNNPGYEQTPMIRNFSEGPAPNRDATQWRTYGVWWRNRHEAFIYQDGQRVMNFYRIQEDRNQDGVPETGGWLTDRLAFGGNFDDDMRIIFDSEVWDWAGSPSPSALNVSDDSNAMQIDWVRGYSLEKNGTDPRPIGQTIRIHTNSVEGGYVWGNPMRGVVAANAKSMPNQNFVAPGGWGEFLVEEGYTPGSVAFKHVTSGRYLSCACSDSVSGASISLSASKFAWESFAWGDLGPAIFSLKAANGKYVSASVQGADPSLAASSADDGSIAARFTYAVVE